MQKKILYDTNEILAILPHRPPFLFVDYVTAFTCNKSIKTERHLRKDEPFFEGHFPQKPIMPGVLVTDALAQTSGLLWGFSKLVTEREDNPRKKTTEIFLLAAVNMKYLNPAYPGDTLRMSSQIENHFGSLYIYSVEAIVKQKLIAKGRLTLAMAKEAI